MRDESNQVRFEILGALSFSHFLNDMLQSLVIAIYPLLKGEFHLCFAGIGAITLVYQFSAGMGLTLAPNYAVVLCAAGLIGSGGAAMGPLLEKFQVSVQAAPVCLFLFLLAMALGTLIGGPVGDRIGRRHVIWASIFGIAPFTLALPHCNLGWTVILTFLIGLVLSSAFSAILVFAQELLPGKVGAVSGLFFGFAFGIVAAFLPRLDAPDIATVAA